jgi:hypothetical protein
MDFGALSDGPPELEIDSFSFFANDEYRDGVCHPLNTSEWSLLSKEYVGVFVIDGAYIDFDLRSFPYDESDAASSPDCKEYCWEPMGRRDKLLAAGTLARAANILRG